MATKDEVARDLAQYHFRVEPELIRVYIILSGSAGEPIRLLEVSSATVPTGSVEPFGFPATGDVPYPTVIAEVTPEEEDRIRQGKVKLPDGWDLDSAERIERPEAA